MGYTWIITPSLVNSLRYGFTRQSYDNTGVQTQPIVSFTSLDNPVASTTPLSAKVPVHDIEENLTWTHGAHTVVCGSIAAIHSHSSAVIR